MTPDTIGTMQGRLLRRYKGQYQAHPVGFWQEEFPLAQQVGLAAIEFVYDFNEVAENPLHYDGGTAEINRLAAKHGIKVGSICANYFMTAPLNHPDPNQAATNGRALQELADKAEAIGATTIVLPAIEGASLQEAAARQRFIERVPPLVADWQQRGLTLAIETDLPPRQVLALLSALASPAIGVTYDTGNSAAAGFAMAEEFATYGAHIRHVHIKDRPLGGGNVFLGTGAVDFAEVFRQLELCGYDGLLIMEAFRGERIVQDFAAQLAILKDLANSTPTTKQHPHQEANPCQEP